MNEQDTTNVAPTSWFNRLSQLLLGEPKNKEELVEVLREATSNQLIDPEALSRIEGVLNVSEMHVKDIMIPRSQMAVIEKDATLEETLRVVIDSAHSRFPVTGETRDEIIGILLAKELLPYATANHVDKFNIRDSLRPAVFVPESKRLDKLLQEFKSKKNHLAIVIDEYGGVTGLVTIEDVLEQIVGDIEDETDHEEDIFIKKHTDTNYSVKALTPIEDFNEYFDTGFPDTEFDTIGGLVLQAFGRLPKRGEEVSLGIYHFKVLHADNRRVHLLQTTVQAKESEA